jgi:hypothetical protein
VKRTGARERLFMLAQARLGEYGEEESEAEALIVAVEAEARDREARWAVGWWRNQRNADFADPPVLCEAFRAAVRKRKAGRKHA